MSNIGHSILLVEDDYHLRELVTMVLELDGYKVVLTENGQEAIDYLTNHSIDLIILDLFMPILDGVHVLNWLRKEKKSTTPVIIMTAMTDEQTQQNMITTGANGVLKKPLDVNKINQAVDAILKN